MKFIDKLLGRNSITTGNAKEIMKRDWESRARENALHYIADFREKWDDDLQGFFE
ncbi:MAG: hypothetical protein JJU11_14665 [Candidatus Sumerlaeia bacterium]|nr:hypothetical protein [Candidatus Sumerlaeia bacterium]